MTKHDIARILHEIAFFLRLNGENPFKAQAYQRAGLALLSAPQDLVDLVATGTLAQLRGIGPATASAITELATTGHSTVHRQVQGTYPSSLVSLGDVPGLRYKQILRLYEDAGITSLAELKAACRQGRLVAVPRIGPKTEVKLLEALGEYERGQGYSLYGDVIGEAQELERTLRDLPDVVAVMISGALRRKMEVVDEFLFVVSSESGVGLVEAVRRIPNLTDVAVHTDHITARSPRGMPMKIAVTTAAEYGFSLLQTTGSVAHLNELLEGFRNKGLRDWAIVKARLPGSSEAALYQAVGLPYIEPELREGRGELLLGEQEQSAALVQSTDIQGLFHVHTQYSDGAGTVEDMVAAACDRGFRYVGISDHSQSAFYANGLKEPRIRTQWSEIERVQQKYPDIHIFKGIEADILPDGALDYPNEMLAEFDFVIASVHSRFNLSERDQTQRICRALSNPYVTMLGHPTGRLLLARPGYRVNLEPGVCCRGNLRKSRRNQWQPPPARFGLAVGTSG
jgi:DNA polymerase (family 10)